MSHAPVPPIAAAHLVVFFLQIGVLLGLALLLGKAGELIGLPAVVGELTVGVLLGPSLLGHLAPGVVNHFFAPNADQMHLLDAVGQLGVVLLVAMTGMHVDIGLVRRSAGTGLTISAAGLLIPLASGVLVGFQLPPSFLGSNGNQTTFALFLGVAMCVSALPVIAKTLADMRLLHRNVSQLTLVSGMVDDAVGWLLLSVVSGLATAGFRAATVMTSVLCLVAILLAAYLAGRPIARALFRWTERADSPNLTVGVVVAFILLCAAGTQALGLEAVFGAFLGGLLISAYGGIEPARLAPLRLIILAVLAPLYFATAGLRVDLTALGRPPVLLAAIVILAVAILGKFVGAFLGARLCRLSRWEAIALGAGMNSRGVVEIVVAMTGLRLGLLNADTFTIVVLVAVITSVMAPPLLRVAMRRVELTAEEQLRGEAHSPFDGSPAFGRDRAGP